MTPYELSEDTVNLLLKGLTFTPAPPSNEAKLRVELSEFVRKLRLKEYFVDKNYVSDDLVQPKSEFTPKKGRAPELDDLANEIEKIEIKEKPFKDNLSKKERKSLNDLRTNDSITIKEADKGGAVVIMTKNYHYEMVMEHLRDESTYLEADLENPNRRVMEIIKEFADEYTLEVLAEKENEYICDFIPTSSKFYCLPKIHKNEEIKIIIEERPIKYLKMSEPPSIPRRPIVGSLNCLTQTISNLFKTTSISS